MVSVKIAIALTLEELECSIDPAVVTPREIIESFENKRILPAIHESLVLALFQKKSGIPLMDVDATLDKCILKDEDTILLSTKPKYSCGYHIH